MNGPKLSLGVAYAANGGPPIGIPWETFQKYIREIYKVYYERKNGCAEDPPESILISATMAKAR